jgi:uncharacterized protein (TIGR02284 family)
VEQKMTNDTFPFALYTTQLTEAAPGISVLNDLLTVCSDGAEGFREAAKAVEPEELTLVLEEHAKQRETFGEYLANFAVELGGEEVASGSIRGAVHRVWMNVKAAIAGGDPAAILAEVARGEQAALDTYTNANISVLPTAMQAAIVQQREAIAHAKKRLEELHRAYSD